MKYSDRVNLEQQRWVEEISLRLSPLLMEVFRQHVPEEEAMMADVFASIIREFAYRLSTITGTDASNEVLFDIIRETVREDMRHRVLEEVKQEAQTETVH